MNKDIIYIDVEDDITAIIGKVKAAKQKVVALVPPKRIGILQSAVNLRLLARASEQSDKRLVLISNNAALMALAAAAKIPVAKNLQSKPALAEIPALDVDDGEDIIDGSQLPIGEHARMANAVPVASIMPQDPAVNEAVRENAAELKPRATPPLPGQPLRKPKAKGGARVPNFDRFRKRLALIIIGGILLVTFLVWAIFFAGSANILITARTADVSVNPEVTLGNDLSASATEATLKTTMQQIKKDLSIDFTATGSKETGERARGQVVFRNCETNTPQTVPSGTAVSANGKDYITQSSVTVPGAQGFATCSQAGESSPVTIFAQDIGEEYDTSNGTQFNVAEHSNSSTTFYFNAVATSDIAGGTKKEIKIVSEQDVEKATEQLVQQNSDEVKKQLLSQFSDTVMTLDQTFKTERGDVSSTPAIGSEASDGSAKLTGTVTYTMRGVDEGEMGRFLDDYFAKELEGENDQRIYDNGSDEAKVADIVASGDNYAATLVATAQVGPKINDEAIKEQSKGKRYGEIQSSIEAINGVSNVDVEFSPFWVSSAPNDTERISIEFELDESE